MRKRTRGKAFTQEAAIFGEDPLAEALRGEIRGVIERVLAEELASALDAGPYARTEGRSGYRNGTEERTLWTWLGKTKFDKPRGRIWTSGGKQEEFQSQLLPRYQRRCRKVDNEILAMYLGGVSTRKVKRIARLLGVAQTLSPTSVSRVVSQLREHFETWQARSLKDEPVVYLYLDAIAVKVRLAKRVVSRPILVAVGVREDGQKVLLGLWSKGSESTESWKDVLDDLVSRGQRRPLLAIIDGGGGRRAARGGGAGLGGIGGAAVPGAQAAQPPSARAQARARRGARRLPRADVRGDGEGGARGVRGVPDQVEQAVRERGQEPGGGGGGAIDLLPVPEVPVELAQDDERDRAAQRGVSPAGQDAELAAQRVGDPDPSVRSSGFGLRPAPEDRRLHPDLEGHQGEAREGCVIETGSEIKTRMDTKNFHGRLDTTPNGSHHLITSIHSSRCSCNCSACGPFPSRSGSKRLIALSLASS